MPEDLGAQLHFEQRSQVLTFEELERTALKYLSAK